MKIRIRQNSIRFRLTRPEVETVCKDGMYREQTEFDERSFIYEVRLKENMEHLEAHFSDNTISLYVPKRYATEWLGTERIGFEHTMALKNGKTLFLLLEKDFVCMDESVEDQANNYPNPKADSLK